MERCVFVLCLWVSRCRTKFFFPVLSTYILEFPHHSSQRRSLAIVTLAFSLAVIIGINIKVREYKFEGFVTSDEDMRMHEEVRHSRCIEART